MTEPIVVLHCCIKVWHGAFPSVQSDFVYIKSSHVMFLDQLSRSYVAVHCGTPRYLSNGQRRYSSTTVGSRVTYTCNAGHLMTAGNSSGTCQSSGLWSGIHPTCEGKSQVPLHLELHLEFESQS